MIETLRRARFLAILATLAMVLVACNGDDPDDTPDNGEAPDDPSAVSFDVGVTEEPCPDAVNEDNGCIYLGTLSDLTVGPFAAFGEQILEGQEAFWSRVNDQGGIGGLFDVDISSHIEDTEYNPQEHVASYQRIQGEVLALAHTLGTPTTLAIAEQMQADDMVGAVLTWWSGWEFEPYGNIIEHGSNYCIDAMNGVEWAQQEFGAETFMTVHFPGDYGGDAASGAEHAIQELGLELVQDFEQIPTALGGETGGAVQAILQNQPDVVFLTVGPTETAEIVGGAAAQGFTGRFVASAPSYAGALLQTAAGDAIAGLLHSAGPYPAWGHDAPGYDAMQETIGEGEEPGNQGWTAGWMAAYPLRSALEQAVSNGDLTRAGVVQAVQEMTVDHEGALPDRQYGGDANETTLRSTTIGQPDAEVPLGVATVEARFEGSVAGGYDFTEACQAIG